MYMYDKKKNHWDLKLIAAAIALGSLGIVLGSWVEAVAEHGADFHAEVPQQDWQNQNDAQEESKGGEPTSYFDDNGVQHIYENGNEHS